MVDTNDVINTSLNNKEETNVIVSDTPEITSLTSDRPTEHSEEVQAHKSSEIKQPSLMLIHLAIISAQVAFGGGSIIGRLGMPSTNPVLFALIREGIAGPLLCLIAYTIDRLFLGPGLSLYCNQLFFIVGLKLSSSVTASAWQPSQPIMAVCLGLMCFKETEPNVDKFKIAGIFFGTIGAVIMVIFGGESGNGNLWRNFGGSFCFFINCLATALYLILGQKPLKVYPSTTVTGYSYIFASVLMVFTSLLVGFVKPILKFVCDDCNYPKGAWHVPIITMYALAYWVIFQSLLSYLMMTWANKYADPSINLGYTVLQPLTAAVVSTLIISFGIVRKCKGSDSSDDTCLYGPSYADLGAIGIIIGLYCIIYSDRRYRKKRTLTHAILVNDTEEGYKELG